MSGTKAKITNTPEAQAKAAKSLMTTYGFTEGCKVWGHEDELTREEWLLERKKGIGGSEVAAIDGVSKFDSPLTLWRKKMDLVKEQEDNELLYYGRMIEDFIAQETLKKLLALDPKAKIVNMKYLLQRDDDGFPAKASTDRMLFFRGKWMVLELKNVNEYVKKDWADGKVPTYYMYQCQHYLYVTGKDSAVISAFIGGHGLKAVFIKRDEALIAKMIKSNKKFWEENIVGESMPAITNPKDAAAISEDIGAKEEYPEIADVEEYPEIGKLCDEWARQKANKKAASDKVDVLKAKILQQLQENKCFKAERDGEKLAAMSFVKGRKSQDEERLASANEAELSVFESFFKTGEPSVRLV